MIKYSDNSESSGIETFDKGDIYEGSFKDGLKHRKGTLKTRNNRSYEGDWENDNLMVLELILFQMVKFIQVTLAKESPSEMVSGLMLMGGFITELGSMVHS